MENDVKEITLQRSESLGFGFSIIGGLGSELPPVICDIVEDSPADHCDQLAAGDAILAVNGVQVSTFTTKEVLKSLRLSGPQLHLKLSQDPEVRARAERYLSCSPEDIHVLRDVISQQDLTGVDELIVKCGASGSPRSSPKRVRSIPQPSPTMPNRRDEETGRGSMMRAQHGHSHIPRMRNDQHPFSKTYHENGVDSHNGKNGRTVAEPSDNASQSKQKERGFETFVMTGDMIIRTTKKSEPARKTATEKIPKKVVSSPSREAALKTPTDSPKAKAKGSPVKSQGSPAKSQGSPSKSDQGSPSKSSQGSPVKTQGSPSKSQGSPSKIPGSPLKSKKPESRIPICSKSRIPKPPSQKGSPKHVPKESPKPGRAPLSFPRNERTVNATMASPESMEIENLEAVNNNVIQNVAKLEETVESRTLCESEKDDIELDLDPKVEMVLDPSPEPMAVQSQPLVPESLALQIGHDMNLQYPVSPPEPMFNLELEPEEALEELGHGVEASDHLVFEEPIHASTQPPSLESSMTGCSMFPAEMSQSAPVTSLGYMSFAGYRFPDVDMALDIPPDDISSEDDNYKNLDSLLDVDDLPPPPDELLQDFNEKPEPQQPLTPYPVSAILLRDSYFSAGAAGAQQASSSLLSTQSDHQVFNGNSHKLGYEPSALETVVEAEGAAALHRDASPAVPVPGTYTRNVSQSAEKIPASRGPGVRYTHPCVGVRTSRSQENYFQNTADGMALVDIDFDESMASSVDALPYSYSEKSSTSLDTVSMPGHVPMHDPHTHEMSRSLDNSPERNYDKYVERIHMPAFINVGDTQTDNRQPHPQSQSQFQSSSDGRLCRPPPSDNYPVDPHDNGVFSQEIPESSEEEESETRDLEQDRPLYQSPSHGVSTGSPAETQEGESPAPSPSAVRTEGAAASSTVITIGGATVTSSSDSEEIIICKSAAVVKGSPELGAARRGSPSRRTVQIQEAKGEESEPLGEENKQDESLASGVLTDGESEGDEELSDTVEQAVHDESEQLSEGEDEEVESSPEAVGGEGSDSESIYHQPIKDVDRPSATRLAKRLFLNDGFKKQDISRHLYKKNDFAQLVGEEYLKFFDFTSDTLEQALRKFLKHLTLAGETQERERVLAHFSKRFMECNPVAFKSEDACHTLTCALMLLNTDLHGQNIGRKMTLNEFIDNLAELNDGNNFPTDTLKQLYTAIKTEPLECEIEQDVEDLEAIAASGRAQAVPPPEQRFIGHNPFLDVPDPSKATEYKKGYVMRKCCLDADGRRTPMGKRGWKMFYATLRDMVLYLHKDEHAMKKSGSYDNMSNAIRIHHSLATKASDYTKKQHVIRLHTADGSQYLFQTSDSKECQEWIDTINFVAASLSAPPLPGGVGSQKKFQRPLMPSSYTKLNLREQLLHHEQQVQQRESELHEHQLYPPEKGAKSRIIQDYVEKERFLQYEMKRFKTYLFLLQAKIASFPELEPSLVEVAIGEVDEPLPSPESSHTLRGTGTSQAPTTPEQQREKSSKPVQRSMSDRLETKL